MEMQFCPECGSALDERGVCANPSCKKHHPQRKNQSQPAAEPKFASSQGKKFTEKGKKIVPDCIQADMDEVHIKQYDIARLQTLIKGARAEGRLQVTNKRLIFRASGFSIVGATSLQHEFSIEEIAGIEIRKEARINGLTTILLVLLLYAVQSILNELTPAHNLSNGDIVTIKITANAEPLEEKGYFLPETMEMTYTVSGLADYYDFSNGFPAGELAALCDKSLSASKKLENEEVQDGYTITAPSQIHKVYSMQVSEPTDLQKDYGHNVSMNNAVCVITSYYVEGTEGMALSREEWTVWVYPNYYVAADGTLGHDETEDFDMFMLAESVEEVEEWLFDEYDKMIFEELNIA